MAANRNEQGRRPVLIVYIYFLFFKTIIYLYMHNLFLDYSMFISTCMHMYEQKSIYACTSIKIIYIYRYISVLHQVLYQTLFWANFWLCHVPNIRNHKQNLLLPDFWEALKRLKQPQLFCRLLPPCLLDRFAFQFHWSISWASQKKWTTRVT